jgi:hypothetical protein
MNTADNNDKQEPVVEEVIDTEEIHEVPVEDIPKGLVSTEKPKNNVFALILLMGLFFILIAIYLVSCEMNRFYGITFGGLLSPPPAPTESEIPDNK